jgi:hypothetical protein
VGHGLGDQARLVGALVDVVQQPVQGANLDAQCGLILQAVGGGEHGLGVDQGAGAEGALLAEQAAAIDGEEDLGVSAVVWVVLGARTARRRSFGVGDNGRRWGFRGGHSHCSIRVAVLGDHLAAHDRDVHGVALGSGLERPAIMPGLPDGATVDGEGCVWLTHWGGSAVSRHAPDGRLIEEIALPVTNPTCPCLGGPDLRTLYLTTATFQLSSDALAQEPLAGAILSLRVNVEGLPEARFAG